MFCICSNLGMERIDETSIATTILNAPGWVRIGITAPDNRMRDDAARELARAIVVQMNNDEHAPIDPNQLRFEL